MASDGSENSAKSNGPVLAAGLLDAIMAILVIAVLAEAAGVDGRGYGDPRNAVAALVAMVYPVLAYYGRAWSLGRWALGVAVEDITWRRQLERDRPILGTFAVSWAVVALRVVAVCVGTIPLCLALRYL